MYPCAMYLPAILCPKSLQYQQFNLFYWYGYVPGQSQYQQSNTLYVCKVTILHKYTKRNKYQEGKYFAESDKNYNFFSFFSIILINTKRNNRIWSKCVNFLFFLFPLFEIEFFFYTHVGGSKWKNIHPLEI